MKSAALSCWMLSGGKGGEERSGEKTERAVASTPSTCAGPAIGPSMGPSMGPSIGSSICFSRGFAQVGARSHVNQQLISIRSILIRPS